MTATSYQTDFPPMETERLLIQSLTIEHTDFIFRHFSNPAVAQYLLDEPPVTEYSQAQEIVRFYLEPIGKTYNRWIIVHKSKHQPIGTCGYHKWDKRYFRAEIGYDLDPDFWGQGYMTEALSAVIDNGFDKMRLNRIEALVYIKNMPSIHLMQRLGFTQDGLLREYFCQDNHFYDHSIYSLLKREWIP
jgi:[ribosomal protein S5]-alanine N-acetyltransferase